MQLASRNLQMLYVVGAVGGLSDGQLLERFAARRDEAAFEALIYRYGPMVWGVCHRILRNHHDAEDAFQATFLVLARKAPSVAHREMVANWLYAVAYKTSVRARAMASKRGARERQLAEMPEPEAGADERWDDLLPLLDRELSRLPEKYRVPILLCDLEGKTHQEAASLLGWPIGTVSGRLSRARVMLAKRLARRGFTPLCGALAAVLSQGVASAGVPNPLVLSTVRAARLIAAGQAAAAGMISPKVAALTQGVLKAMLLCKLKATIAVVIVLGLMTNGAKVLSVRTAVAKDEPPKRDHGVAKDEPPKRDHGYVSPINNSRFFGLETDDSSVVSLLTSPIAVDLRFTEDQTDRLKAVYLPVAHRIIELLKRLRSPSMTTVQGRVGIRSEKADLAQQLRAAMLKELDEAQRRRLREIGLQVAGPSVVVTDGWVTQQLNLSGPKKDKLRRVVAELWLEESGVMQEHWDRFEALKGETAAVRIAEADRMRVALSRLRRGALGKLLDVLDRDQVATLRAVFGEPYDLSKLNGQEDRLGPIPWWDGIPE